MKKNNSFLPFLAIIGIVVIVAIFLLVLYAKTAREAVVGQASTTLLSLGSVCTRNDQCASAVCGINNNGIRVCVLPRIDRVNDLCLTYAECASGYCPIPTKGTATCRACTADSNCQLGEVCGIDNLGVRVCTVMDSDGTGSRCLVDDECGSGLCGMNNSGTRVCANPRSDLNSSRCVTGNECVSGYCPIPTSGNQICRSCSTNNQCSSGVCNQGGFSTPLDTRFTCVECNVSESTYQYTAGGLSYTILRFSDRCVNSGRGEVCSPVSGGACRNRWASQENDACNFDDECASGSCFMHYGRGTCDPFGTALVGASCSYNYDCVSGLCGYVGPGNAVCTTPFSESSLSACGSDRECQSHRCESGSCTG